jgi:hypothetical protein
MWFHRAMITLSKYMCPYTFLVLVSDPSHQMLENERIQVKELKNRGYSPRQLQEMGYSEASMHSPPLALAKKY